LKTPVCVWSGLWRKRSHACCTSGKLKSLHDILPVRIYQYLDFGVGDLDIEALHCALYWNFLVSSRTCHFCWAETGQNNNTDSRLFTVCLSSFLFGSTPPSPSR